MPNKYLCPDVKWAQYLNSDERCPEGICVYGAVGNLGLCLHPCPAEVTVCLLESSIFPMASQPITLLENLLGEDVQQLWGAGLALHPKLLAQVESCQYLCCIPSREGALRNSKPHIFGAGSWLRQEWECCHDVYWINVCYCCSHLSVQFWRSCRWPFKYLQSLQLFQSRIFFPLSPSYLAPYSN